MRKIGFVDNYGRLNYDQRMPFTVMLWWGDAVGTDEVNGSIAQRAGI